MSLRLIIGREQRLFAALLQCSKGRFPHLDLKFRKDLTFRFRPIEDWECCLLYALSNYYKENSGNLLPSEFIAQALAKHYGTEYRTIATYVKKQVAIFRNEELVDTQTVKRAVKDKAVDEWVRAEARKVLINFLLEQ